MYKALSVCSVVKQIDTALGLGDYATLMRFIKTKGCIDLLSDEVETGYVQSQSDSGSIVSKPRQPNCGWFKSVSDLHVLHLVYVMTSVTFNSDKCLHKDVCTSGYVR